LEVHRSAIVEAHTKHQDSELPRYELIARKHNVPIINILLLAPLNICLERSSNRHVPGISYEINSEMVTDYYCNLDPMEGDLVFDTTANSPESIAELVIA